MRDPDHPPELARDAQDPSRLRLQGRWTLAHANEIGLRLRDAPDAITTVDASDVDRLDSAGVLQLLRFGRRRGIAPEGFAFRDDHRDLVSAIEDVADDRPKKKREYGVVAALARLGYAVQDNWKEILALVAFLREFGVLLTAIILAGRTASAFTAQIGAMKSREEIDAIRTLGLDPIDLLVLPRVIALLVMLPLLTFIAMLAGLAGGMSVGAFSLGIPPEAYFARMDSTLELRHFLVGLVKAPVFAMVIALIGCLEGLQVEGTAQSVGERTTSSVVQTISLVIVLDALFAIWFMQMDW